jgi:hypothetical protein
MLLRPDDDVFGATGWRNAREQRPGAVQRGRFREIETIVENPDAVALYLTCRDL